MMRKKDTYYSHSELLGLEPSEVDIYNDIYYSEREVKNMIELFEEFYSENSDFYSSIDDAYSEFVDAYSSTTTIILDDKEQKAPPKKDKEKGKAMFSLNPKQTKIASAAVGAGAGYGISKLMTKKLNSKIKELQNKVNTGQATREEFNTLKNLKRKLNNITGGSAIAGGASGYAISSYVGRKK